MCLASHQFPFLPFTIIICFVSKIQYCFCCFPRISHSHTRLTSQVSLQNSTALLVWIFFIFPACGENELRSLGSKKELKCFLDCVTGTFSLRTFFLFRFDVISLMEDCQVSRCGRKRQWSMEFRIFYLHFTISVHGKFFPMYTFTSKCKQIKRSTTTIWLWQVRKYANCKFSLSVPHSTYRHHHRHHHTVVITFSRDIFLSCFSLPLALPFDAL